LPTGTLRRRNIAAQGPLGGLGLLETAMSDERVGLSGMAVLIGLVAAVLVAFTVLLLLNARHNQPLRTDAVSSASSSLAATP
jgi:hypothetical protein